MQVAPWKRITAEEALAHPYLELYHDLESEPIGSSTIQFDANALEHLSPQGLKEELVNEVVRTLFCAL